MTSLARRSDIEPRSILVKEYWAGHFHLDAAILDRGDLDRDDRAALHAAHGFGDPALDGLAQELVRLRLSGVPLDSAAMRRHLAQSGHDALVREVEKAAAKSGAPFLAGALLDGWYAPSLRQDHNTGRRRAQSHGLRHEPLVPAQGELVAHQWRHNEHPTHGKAHQARSHQGDDAAEPVRVTVDTPFCTYSTAKGVAVTVLHRLIERGDLDLEARVADYMPEFTSDGKDRITVRHHRGRGGHGHPRS